MKKLLLSMATIPLLVGGLSVSASADEGLSILNDITVKGEIRPRYEYADVKDNNLDAANAFTNRLSLAVTAGLFEIEGLSTTLGIMAVNNFGSDKYNSGQNGEIQYDKVIDHQQAMLSEAMVNYKIGKTTLSAGRSHLNIDNQRFIGTVGWRQMERAYDTVQIKDNSIENLDLLAAYMYGYAGVGSTETTNTKSAILNAKYKIMDELSVTGYGYLIGSEYDTYGVALTGKVDVGAKITYRAEYAIQDDASLEYGNNPKKADAEYINLDIGSNISGFIVGANYEFLSGSTGTDGKTNFNPSLGTNHKFNGWADKFFVGNSGPQGGLIDTNIRLGYKAKGFGKLLAVYHDFEADKKMGGEDDLGTEFDVLYANSIPGVKGLTGLVKHASYSKGKVAGYTLDVTKTWLMLTYKF